MAKDTIRLRAPRGTDEANYGDQLHRVDNDGTVEVTTKEAGALLKRGGFELADKEEIPMSGGTVEMLAPEKDSSCSWGGENFQATDGVVTVPLEAAPDLLHHGYSYK